MCVDAFFYLQPLNHLETCYNTRHRWEITENKIIKMSDNIIYSNCNDRTENVLSNKNNSFLKRDESGAFVDFKYYTFVK